MTQALWIRNVMGAAFVSILAPGAAFAADTAREFDQDVIARIRGSRGNEKIVLPSVFLSDTETRTIELEEFSVYTPDAAILVYDSNPPRRIAPPARRYFRGRVVDDPTATVFLSVSTNSSDVEGLISVGGKTIAIGRGRRLKGPPMESAEQIELGERRAPILVAEVDAFAGGSQAAPFTCGTESRTVPAGELTSRSKTVAPATTATSYQLRIAVDTDNQLHAGFGQPGAATDAAVNNYIGNLVAQASLIYMRDLNTTLNIGQVNIRPSNVPDPWADSWNTASLQALAEFGTYWHDNYPSVVRSAAVMVSGQGGGGIAWTGRICRNDFNCSTGCFGDPTTANQWGGAYAMNGSFGSVEVVVPGPNDTVGGILYGLPVDNYWMLQGFAHELGHVLGSPHTHCVGLDAAEKATYNVTRDFVDQCFSTSQFGCYSGAPSVPAEKGTIMSYCYLATRNGGYPESRYLFGEAGKPSAKMLAILRENLEFRSESAAITVGSNLACAPGQTASVSGCVPDCSYAWTIAGGSIQGSTTSSSISFTPSAADVTLTATVANAKECKATTSFATTSQCGAPPGQPALSINDVTVAEGNSGMTAAVFSVSLTPASSQTVTVAYATTAGTATPGTDYTAGSGTLSFAPGEAGKSISVTVVGDTTPEPNETLLLDLSSPTNATIAKSRGTGTIMDDDATTPGPQISIDDRSVNEGSAVNAAFRVFLSAPSSQNVTVGYATADGTAVAPADYTAVSGTVTFTPGRTQQTIIVPISSDTTAEASESFSVNLSNPVNATLLDAQAVGTIGDPPAAAKVAMYRSYSAQTDYHFFTTDVASKNFAVGTLGFRDESSPIPFYVWNVQQPGTAPLFRIYNPNLGRHFYTASAGSRDFLISIGATYEKEEGFLYPAAGTAGTTELFLLYNNNSGTHLFTADKAQRDGILSLFPGVWVANTSVGYVFTSP